MYFPLRYTDRRHSRTLCSACPRRIRRGYNGKRRVIQKPPCFTTGRTMFIMNKLQSNFKIKTKIKYTNEFLKWDTGESNPFLYQSKLQNNNYLNIIGFCSVCLVYLFATDDTNVSLHAGLSSRTDRTQIYSTKHFIYKTQNLQTYIIYRETRQDSNLRPFNLFSRAL